MNRNLSGTTLEARALSRRRLIAGWLTAGGVLTGAGLLAACGAPAAAPTPTTAPKPAAPAPTTAAAPAATAAPTAAAKPTAAAAASPAPQATTAAPSATTAPAAAAPKGGIIRLTGSGGRTKYYTPLWWYPTTAWMNTMSHVWPGLITFDAKDEAVPLLAERYEVSKDAKTFTFYLPKKAKWSDGTPLTARDVKFTWEMHLKPGFHELTTSGFGMFPAKVVEGGQAYAEGKATEVTGIQLVDDNTVRFVLAAPDVTFPRYLDRSIAPSHIYKSDDTLAKVEANPFTKSPNLHSGPFRLAEYKETQYIQLESAHPYWDMGPNLREANVDKLIMFQGVAADTALARVEAGEIEIMKRVRGAALKRAQTLKNATLMSVPSSSFGGFGVNTRRDHLKDKRAKHAFNHAINRETINKLNWEGKGQPITSPVNVPEWAVNPNLEPYKHDPARANSILKEISWDFNRELVYLSTVEGEDPLAAYFQQALGDAGVKVKIMSAKFSAFQEVMGKGDLDFWHESGYDGGHPSTAAINFTCGAVNAGWAGYCNKELDDLVAKSAAATDRNEAQQLAWKISAILNDELPYLWTTRDPQVHLVSNRVGNFVMTPSNNSTTFHAFDWYLKP